MTSELLWPQLTERYVRGRGVRCFRGQHDSEYFFIVKRFCGRLHVHMRQSADGRSVAIDVTVPRYFPAADRPRLSKLARRWNRRGGPIKAVLLRSTDPTRVGVAVRCDAPIEAFTDMVDACVARAAEFFSDVAAVLESPDAPSRRVLLPQAS